MNVRPRTSCETMKKTIVSLGAGLVGLVGACTATDELNDLEDDRLQGQCLSAPNTPVPVDPNDFNKRFVAYAMAGDFVGPTSHGTLHTELRITARTDNTRLYVTPAPNGGQGASYHLATEGETLILSGYSQFTGVTIYSDHPIAGTGTFYDQYAPEADARQHPPMDPSNPGVPLNDRANSDRPWLRDAYAFASGNRGSDAEAAIPLVMNDNFTLTGTGGTDLFVQNTHLQAQVVHVTANRIGGGSSTYCTELKPGQAIHLPANVLVGDTAGWVGSAEVRGESGPVLALANVYTDATTQPDRKVASLQTYRGFPRSMASSKWIVPLMASRLNNGFNTPLSVQNRSGGEIPAGGIVLDCKPGEKSVYRDFAVENPAAVEDQASMFFNPAPGDAPFDEIKNFYGTCTIEAKDAQGNPADIVVMPQSRLVSSGDRVGDAGAYHAYPVNDSHRETNLMVPWNVQSPLSEHRDKSAVTIVNLTEHDLNGIEACYQPGDHCKTFNLPRGGQELENGHLFSSDDDGIDGVSLVDNEEYVLTIHSPDGPIGAFNQVKRYGATKQGDSFMAYNAISPDESSNVCKALERVAESDPKLGVVVGVAANPELLGGWLHNSGTSGGIELVMDLYNQSMITAAWGGTTGSVGTEINSLVDIEANLYGAAAGPFHSGAHEWLGKFQAAEVSGEYAPFVVPLAGSLGFSAGVTGARPAAGHSGPSAVGLSLGVDIEFLSALPQPIAGQFQITNGEAVQHGPSTKSMFDRVRQAGQGLVRARLVDVQTGGECTSVEPHWPYTDAAHTNVSSRKCTIYFGEDDWPHWLKAVHMQLGMCAAFSGTSQSCLLPTSAITAQLMALAVVYAAWRDYPDLGDQLEQWCYDTLGPDLGDRPVSVVPDLDVRSACGDQAGHNERNFCYLTADERATERAAPRCASPADHTHCGAELINAGTDCSCLTYTVGPEITYRWAPIGQ